MFKHKNTSLSEVLLDHTICQNFCLISACSTLKFGCEETQLVVGLQTLFIRQQEQTAIQSWWAEPGMILNPNCSAGKFRQVWVAHTFMPFSMMKAVIP